MAKVASSRHVPLLAEQAVAVPMVGVFGGFVAHVGRRVPELEVEGRVFESLGIALLGEAAETGQISGGCITAHERRRRPIEAKTQICRYCTHLLKQIVWMSVGERFVDGNIYSTSTPTTKKEKRKKKKEKEKEGKNQ